MLTSDWNMERADLDNLIRKWYENEKFYVLYDCYLDSNYWFKDEGVLLTNVCLSTHAT